MSKIYIHKLLFLVVILPVIVLGQRNPKENGKVGEFTFGVRNTISVFSDDNRRYVGMSVGGNLRFRLTEQLNLGAFGDYITTDISGLATRTDFHGGFSVMPYLFNRNQSDEIKLIHLFPIAGFCIDYSKFTKSGNQIDLPNDLVEMERYSFAAQFGAGSHFNLTERLDLTFVTHYMFHMGTDIHIHTENNQIHFEEQSGGSLEGHLLFTLSINIVIADLW